MHKPHLSVTQMPMKHPYPLGVNSLRRTAMWRNFDQSDLRSLHLSSNLPQVLCRFLTLGAAMLIQQHQPLPFRNLLADINVVKERKSLANPLLGFQNNDLTVADDLVDVGKGTGIVAAHGDHGGKSDQSPSRQYAHRPPGQPFKLGGESNS